MLTSVEASASAAPALPVHFSLPPPERGRPLSGPVVTGIFHGEVDWNPLSIHFHIIYCSKCPAVDPIESMYPQKIEGCFFFSIILGCENSWFQGAPPANFAWSQQLLRQGLHRLLSCNDLSSMESFRKICIDLWSKQVIYQWYLLAPELLRLSTYIYIYIKNHIIRYHKYLEVSPPPTPLVGGGIPIA